MFAHSLDVGSGTCPSQPLSELFLCPGVAEASVFHWRPSWDRLVPKLLRWLANFPAVLLPPDLAPGIPVEEKKLAEEERAKKKEGEARLRGEEGREEKRQAGADESPLP